MVAQVRLQLPAGRADPGTHHSQPKGRGSGGSRTLLQGREPSTDWLKPQRQLCLQPQAHLALSLGLGVGARI